MFHRPDHNQRFARLVSILCLFALLGAVGCGPDDGGSNQSGNNGDGDSQTSSFDATVEGDQGSERLENSQPNQQAGQQSWGATIADTALTVTMVSTSGTSITARIETSASQPAPGRFAAGTLADGTYVSLVSAADGDGYDSVGSGSIVLESCPEAAGDKAVGSFDDVVLESSTTGATRTLSGSFDVVVYAKAGDLICESESTNNGSTNNGGTCSLDKCGDGGVCCPYVQCMSQCQSNCLFQDPACAPGGDPVQCSACANGCLDECNVDDACRSAFADLSTCSEANSCGPGGGAGDEICVENNCCAEHNAAF